MPPFLYDEYMLTNLKLIFVHGINEQTTNYSQGLYLNILAAARNQLAGEGYDEKTRDEILQKIVHHEVLWADLTTDLTNRYMQLEYYQKPRPFWSFLSKPIDPLALQIMQYIKDKGDKLTGKMNILKELDTDMEKIFTYEDVGKDARAQDGQNAIIIAHSLGSVIAFDYVMGFRKECKLKKDITIKSFITMGSPIPLFTSAMGHPDSDLTLPSNIERWVNIICPQDGIARFMKQFFKKIPIIEQQVSTGFWPINAHAGYWKNNATAQIIANEALLALGCKLSDRKNE